MESPPDANKPDSRSRNQFADADVLVHGSPRKSVVTVSSQTNSNCTTTTTTSSSSTATRSTTTTADTETLCPIELNTLKGEVTGSNQDSEGSDQGNSDHGGSRNHGNIKTQRHSNLSVATNASDKSQVSTTRIQLEEKVPGGNNVPVTTQEEHQC